MNRIGRAITIRCIFDINNVCNCRWLSSSPAVAAMDRTRRRDVAVQFRDFST